MALTKTDLKNIKDLIDNSIESNNRNLMVWMSQNFLSKDEAASKKDLFDLTSNMNNKFSEVHDAIATLDTKFT